MADIIAQTVSGKIRGFMDRNICVFKGIPYGSPTNGPRRFLPPIPPKPWDDVRETLKYGFTCPQFNTPARGDEIPPLGRPLEIPHGEDCLVLNVWSRGLADDGKRPVMVWLHGGGYVVGSGSSELYNGVNLASRGDVVVVTINHRLNVFGHLYLDKTAEEQFSGSGNAGLLDIILALEWVRDNINNFGGDPENVTIFGESGGGGGKYPC